MAQEEKHTNHYVM